MLLDKEEVEVTRGEWNLSSLPCKDGSSDWQRVKLGLEPEGFDTLRTERAAERVLPVKQSTVPAPKRLERRRRLLLEVVDAKSRGAPAEI